MIHLFYSTFECLKYTFVLTLNMHVKFQSWQKKLMITEYLGLDHENKIAKTSSY